MSEPKRSKARYKTTNRAGYNAALQARGSDDLAGQRHAGYAPASGKRGRKRVFSGAAIPFCLRIKCLFGLALRQSLGLVESLLRLAGLDWRVPDFSTVCRSQKTLLRVQLPYRATTSRWICWWTAPASSFWARGNGSARSTGPSTGASDARCTWGLTPTRWGFEPSK